MGKWKKDWQPLFDERTGLWQAYNKKTGKEIHLEYPKKFAYEKARKMGLYKD